MLAEPINRHDKRAAAIYRDGEIDGHILRELSKFRSEMKLGGQR